MEAPSIRFCAQSAIFENYLFYVSKIILKYQYFFTILPSMKLDHITTSHNNNSDISILIIRESEVGKQTQNSWFMKTTNNIVKNTKKKLLIIIFSDINQKISDLRKTFYESQIPNCEVKYLDFEDWFPANTDDYFNRHYKNLTMLDEVIVDFMTSVISDINIY
jgi:hypothetical protein